MSQVPNCSQADDDLQQWMVANVQPEFHERFRELGAEELQDLQDLNEPDLEKIGMQPLKRRKILRAVRSVLGLGAFPLLICVLCNGVQPSYHYRTYLSTHRTTCSPGSSASFDYIVC